jgi:hypothetical protein
MLPTIPRSIESVHGEECSDPAPLRVNGDFEQFSRVIAAADVLLVRDGIRLLYAFE